MSAQSRPRRWALGLLGAAAGLFVVVLIVVGLANAGHPAAAPSQSGPSSGADAAFLAKVSADVSADALAAMGKTDDDVVSAARYVCTLREQGERTKQIVKEQALAPWIVTGRAGHFVTASISQYCPDRSEG